MPHQILPFDIVGRLSQMATQVGTPSVFVYKGIVFSKEGYPVGETKAGSIQQAQEQVNRYGSSGVQQSFNEQVSQGQPTQQSGEVIDFSKKPEEQKQRGEEK